MSISMSFEMLLK